MRRKLVTVIGIGRGKRVYWLARLFYPIEAATNGGKAGLPATHKAVHVNDDSLYAVICLSKFQRTDNVALTHFTNGRSR